VLLEVQAWVKKGASEDSFVVEDEGDEKPSDPAVSVTSSSGTPGASPNTKSSSWASDDCVPSICEESTASRRT
jgi:hypothetical protein